MVDLEYLHSLYNDNDYETCLEATKLFLLVNDQNTEALLLKAKCEYQIVLIQRQVEELPENANPFEAVHSSFQSVLQSDPSNKDALLYLAYINIFLLRANLEEAITYCDLLATSAEPETKIKALSYRQSAYQQTGDIQRALEDVDNLIVLINEFYKEDRRALDIELGQVYITKGNLYLEQKNGRKKALEIFKEGMKYVYPGAMTYCAISNLALDHQDYELGGKAAIRAFLSNTSDVGEEFLSLYRRLEALRGDGTENRSILEAIFIALRLFAEELGCDTVEMLNFAQLYIRTYPDWYIPYNYAGAALYDAGSYAEALPYLEKSLQLGGGVYGVQRFFETAYRITGVLPELEKWPEGSAADYYNAGVNFHEFETMVQAPEVGPELLKLRTNFYKRSYEGFYNYFYNQQERKEPNGTFDTNAHIFAMCCNNYGIALTALGDYEKAVEVHQVGYSLSQFWEQLSSWGTALKKLERYEEALEVFSRAAAYSGDYLDFINYIELKGEILEILFKLDRLDETRELLGITDEEYYSFIKEHQNDLSAEYLFTLSERYITVHNTRLDLLKESSLEEANRVWLELLEKYPDDNSAWFMLLQNYYQMKDYRQCIACADNYQSIKGEAIQLESIQKVHFMRGMSYLYLENYDKAKENLSILLNSCKSGEEAEEGIICDANFRLSECCYKQHQWEECMAFAWDGIDCYNRNGWKWDETRIQMTLYYADACKAIGETKAALGTLDTILEMIPGHPEALKRKEEWKSSRGFFSFFK